MPITVGQDSSNTRRILTVGTQSVDYYSIPAAEAAGLGSFAKLPAALKVVLENMLRFEDGKTVSVDDIKAFAEWGAKGGNNPREIAYRPARVLMQDFTGVPAVVDLAAMRDGIKSSALRLGDNVQAGVIAFYCLALTMWGLAFLLLREDWLALLALIPAGLHLLWQAFTLNPADGGNALTRFRSNRFAGLLVAAACYVVGNA